MKPFLRLAVVLGIASISLHAGVTVTNVRSAQRAGTKLVDIDYNLAGSTPPFTVSVRISGDDGASFAEPVTSLSGAFGAGQTSGTDKRITWNAGVDWNGKYTPNMRFEVTATDTATPPVVPGFVLIPAGTFTMGDALDGDAAAPVHTVDVNAFCIRSMETTYSEWKTVYDWAIAHNYSFRNTGLGKGPTHPVHTVNWFDVVKWCNARTEYENATKGTSLTPCYSVPEGIFRAGEFAPTCDWAATGYRLPSEAEWEKATRAGQSGKRFPWGDNITHQQANYNSSAFTTYDVSLTRGDHPNYDDDGVLPYTSPVGSFPAHGGLHDMAGNLYEWCWDWYGWSYPASGQADAHGVASGLYRMSRGGSWARDGGAINCRVACRSFSSPGYSGNGAIGFRLARSSVP